VKFSPRICIDLTGVSDQGWGVRTPGPPSQRRPANRSCISII